MFRKFSLHLERKMVERRLNGFFRLSKLETLEDRQLMGADVRLDKPVSVQAPTVVLACQPVTVTERVSAMRNTKAGFTLVELLVVIAIIGILVGLLLPAVQAAREAARATQCKNNLHQIALATTMFHDAYRAYPPARYQPKPGSAPELSCGGSETTWLVRIMPFLEQSAAQARWDFSAPYSSHPDEVRRFTVASYCCPSRRSASEAVGEGLLAGTVTTWVTLPCGCRYPVVSSGTQILEGAVGDYGGNHGDLSPGSVGSPNDFYYGGNGTGVIISSQAKCHSGIPMDWADKVKQADITDGLSNTFLAGEMHVPLGKLGKAPQDAFIFNGDSAFNSTRIGGPTVPIIQDLHDESNGLVSWGSWHPGVSHFALADGSVRGVSKMIDTESLGNLCNRHDGSVVTNHD